MPGRVDRRGPGPSRPLQPATISPVAGRCGNPAASLIPAPGPADTKGGWLRLARMARVPRGTMAPASSHETPASGAEEVEALRRQLVALQRVSSLGVLAG